MRQVEREVLVQPVSSDKTQGNDVKLHQGSLDWMLGRSCSLRVVVEHWSSLRREVVVTPNLSEFKKHLGHFLQYLD